MEEDTNSRLRAGDIIKHFKRDGLTEEQLQKEPNMYLYIILSTNVKHTEAGEIGVMYTALYGNLQSYFRPREMFFSKVDREKYTNAIQEYRFEKFKDKPYVDTLIKINYKKVL